ncbi:MAG: DEAD/DEAH box helicase family protein [Cyanobacteria bacterium]|jgi:SNF2 family DNA or RNA helicase|nr:DEAD/DEAH box helicase family protein [Cyanobacteria bacterium GSL.Bin1]
MQILHGTWIPETGNPFIQTGQFYLWVETTQKKTFRQPQQRHPWQLTKSDLATLLTSELGIKPPEFHTLEELIEPRYFLLPTIDDQPLPSLELSRYLETELPDSFDWQYWQVDSYSTLSLTKTGTNRKNWVNSVIPLLNDLHFITLHRLSEIQMGSDLLFWFHFTQALKQIILKDQYIPALKYRELKPQKKTSSKSKRKSKTATPFEIYPGWELIGEEYETLLNESVESMPLMCAAGFAEPPETPQFYDRASLLHHFSECLLTEIVTHTYTTKGFEKQIADSILEDCLNRANGGTYWTSNDALEQYKQWQTWRDRVVSTHTSQAFYLYFHLQEPPKPEDSWILEFQVAPKSDPSLRVSLNDYWRMRPDQQEPMKQQLGEEFEKHLLLNLGYAARIYPDLWRGLETDQPVGIFLNLDGAFNFLKESAWVLENAGYKVIVPAWWTPQGRQRAKVKLKASSKSGSPSDDSQSYFSLDTLVQYQYELAIGDEPVTEEEWQQLIEAKTPLVKFRGQWMELNQDKMKQMLEFWKKHQEENPELSLLEFMKLTAEGEEEELEVECDREDSLAQMLSKLNNQQQFQLITTPEAFQGTLRDYQKRGLSWLQYLEQLGLNGCLADDMGLGKTIQVIARLLQERETNVAEIPPTLLIAPTSVVGNWYHEIQKFAPQLNVIIHHGSDRAKETAAFEENCANQDIIITSFALARKDAKLFKAMTWHRIVLDEAQNIKNPKAALTKAILKFSAPHRLALTGTPIENRLLDLWSIFNFLNPGYLGTQAQFRRNFELPIQKDNNRRQSATLKKLVEPFILRRVKTDQAIIKDLPDKVEQKLYCNLTKEQASLYEAVVKDVEKQLAEAEGMQRKGLILATLAKLKQVCNHPMQFLQDGSEFTTARSHKLTRLSEMVEEAMTEGDSLLVFTQFTEIGTALEKYLRHECHYNTYYLHGGTTQKKREAMISEFQSPETEPSVFILSLKAGGVGITLTKANHVFHFDRWWNPSVENQATDRAFRIGQQKNVFVHKFVTTGTLEERIDEMIEDKKKLAGSIVGSDESWLTELDDNAFRELISLNKTAIME